MKAIYTWISQSIVVTSVNSTEAYQSVNDILESKKGNDAEITFLLLSMLKSIGIDGDPVLLSTRNNGTVQELYPIISQFNYVVARVKVNGTEYFLDATDPVRPMDLIPTKIINVRGFVVNKDSGGTWVNITSSKQNNNATLTTMKVHEDGSMEAMVDEAYRDYGGLFIRKDFIDKKELDVVKTQYQTEQQGLTVDSLRITNKDSLDLPFSMKLWLSSTTYAQKSGDNIFINPMIVHRMDDNPFKSRTRLFPINYGYLSSQKFVILLTIPDGYEVKSGLNERALYVGNNLLSYKREYAISGNQVRITIKRDIRQIEIPERYYADLKSFYTSIVAAESEQLVISKIQKQEEQKLQAAPEIKKSALKKKGK